MEPDQRRVPVVVKCGGTAAVDAAAVCADVARLTARGTPVVVVHGGSADIEALADRLGVARRRLVAPDGVTTRYTDPATMEVVQLALAGAVKPRLVSGLARHGVAAVGLTGADGQLVRAAPVAAVRAVVDGRRVLVRDNRIGRILDVRVRLLRTLLDADLVPVVSPPALTDDGELVNVDADRVAAAIAAGLGARDLVLLTGAPGVLRDPTDPASALSRLAVDGTVPEGVGGGMALKLVAAHQALRAGVGTVVVASGAVETPVLAALGGAGTRVVLAEPVLTRSGGKR